MDPLKIGLVAAVLVVAVVMLGYWAIKKWSPQYVWTDTDGVSMAMGKIGGNDPNFVTLGTNFKDISEVKAMVNDAKVYDRIVFVKNAPGYTGYGVGIKIGAPGTAPVQHPGVVSSVIASNETAWNKAASYLDPVLGWMVGIKSSEEEQK